MRKNLPIREGESWSQIFEQHPILYRLTNDYGYLSSSKMNTFIGEDFIEYKGRIDSEILTEFLHKVYDKIEGMGITYSGKEDYVDEGEW